MMKYVNLIKNFFKDQYQKFKEAKTHVDSILKITPPTILENLVGFLGIIFYVVGRLSYPFSILPFLGACCFSYVLLSLGYRNLFKEIIPNFRKHGIRSVLYPRYPSLVYQRPMHTSSYILFKTTKTLIYFCMGCVTTVGGIDWVASSFTKMSILDEVGKLYFKEQTFEQARERLLNPGKYRPILGESITDIKQIVSNQAQEIEKVNQINSNQAQEIERINQINSNQAQEIEKLKILLKKK
jgi:uncharacterized protein YdbL (DUF1318 family)